MALHMYYLFWIEMYLCHSFFVDFYPYNNDSHMILQYIFSVDISRVCHITTVQFESNEIMSK